MNMEVVNKIIGGAIVLLFNYMIPLGLFNMKLEPIVFIIGSLLATLALWHFAFPAIVETLNIFFKKEDE